MGSLEVGGKAGEWTSSRFVAEEAVKVRVEAEKVGSAAGGISVAIGAPQSGGKSVILMLGNRVVGKSLSRSVTCLNNGERLESQRELSGRRSVGEAERRRVLAEHSGEKSGTAGQCG